jgi:hypothetical protein
MPNQELDIGAKEGENEEKKRKQPNPKKRNYKALSHKRTEE